MTERQRRRLVQDATKIGGVSRCKIEDRHDRCQVSVGKRLFYHLRNYLPTYRRQCLFPQVRIVSDNSASEVDEDASNDVRAERGIVEQSFLTVRHGAPQVITDLTVRTMTVNEMPG